MIEPADEVLALKFRERGDREALGDLVRRYQGPIFAYLRRLLKDPHDAEEAAQDCFLRMFRGLPGYRESLPFRPWVYRIALNSARTVAARKAEQARRERVPSSGAGGTGPMGPVDEAVRKELERLVDELPETQKEALTLHYYQGLSHSEVASALDIPEGTAATRIHSGLQALRTRLAAPGLATSAVSLEAMLGPAEAAAAPESILAAVLREAAAGATAKTAVAAALQGGVAVVKAKTSVMVAIALACAGGGGVVGYGIRSTRDNPEAVKAPLTAAKPRDPGRATEARPGPEAEAKPAPAVAVGPTVNAAAASPLQNPRKSKYRKLAAFMARIIRTAHGEESPKAEFETAQGLLEVMSVMLDVEFLKESSSPEGELELTAAVFEELGTPLSEGQKKLLADLNARQKVLEKQDKERATTAVEAEIFRIRRSRDNSEASMAVLTAEQRRAAGILHDLEGLPSSAIVMEATSPDRVASALLDSWSDKLGGLTEVERARLADAAAIHSQRLLSIRDELQARHGAGFVAALAESSSGPARWSGDSLRKDPAFGSKAREAHLRLLDAEHETRLRLMALLPDRADEIKNANSQVYLVGGK